jgi:hypothetical protein
MNDVLITPIIMKEQHKKINAMVKGKGIVPMVQWYNGGTLCAILAHYKS